MNGVHKQGCGCLACARSARPKCRARTITLVDDVLRVKASRVALEPDMLEAVRFLKHSFRELLNPNLIFETDKGTLKVWLRE